MTERTHRKTDRIVDTACVFVALGANLPSAWGPPRATLTAALEKLCQGAITLVARSPWYETAPVPDPEQPWYVNAVAEIATTLEAAPLLARLHDVEAEFGRVRRERWGARAIDLDLIDYRGMVSGGPGPQLPHPRMAERAFVLQPLADIAPHWRHPVTGCSVSELLAAAAPGASIRRLGDSGQ